jgi:hypothetical protein
MDRNWPPYLVAANDWDGPHAAPPVKRRRFALELDRNGLFLTLGRTDFYLCLEPSSAWHFEREPGGFDAQAWRVHAMIGRVARDTAA